MRIGLFGGMFDPPHIGHLILAERTADLLSLDKIIIFPAGNHPTKPTITSAEDRLALCRLTFTDNPKFEVSDIEVTQDATSYTIDTIKAFKQQYPEAELFLCIGADNATSFHNWHLPEEIVKLCKIVVWAREVITIDSPFAASMSILPTPLLHISSTEIRTITEQEHSIRYMVSDAARKYITSKKLYR